MFLDYKAGGEKERQSKAETFRRKIRESSSDFFGAEGNLVFIPPPDPYLACSWLVCILSPFISPATRETPILYDFSQPSGYEPRSMRLRRGCSPVSTCPPDCQPLFVRSFHTVLRASDIFQFTSHTGPVALIG